MHLVSPVNFVNLKMPYCSKGSRNSSIFCYVMDTDRCRTCQDIYFQSLGYCSAVNADKAAACFFSPLVLDDRGLGLTSSQILMADVKSDHIVW